MRKYVKQEIPTYTKQDHIHRCLAAFKSKDLKAFILHFLYHINGPKNEPQTEETTRASIVRLTGWSGKSITNAICDLIADGEFERVNQHKFRLNPKLANRFPGYGANVDEYTGKSPRYNSQQLELKKELEKLRRSYIKFEDYENAETLREQEIEMSMVASLKTEMVMIQDQMASMRMEIKSMFSEMFAELRKHDPEKAEQIKERHLHLVPVGDE